MEEQTIAARPAYGGHLIVFVVEDGQQGEKRSFISVDQIDEAVEKLLNAKNQASAARLKGGR